MTVTPSGSRTVYDETEPAMVALVASLRELMDATVLTRAGDDVLADVTAAVDAARATLAGADRDLLVDRMPWPEANKIVHGDRPHNPVMGPVNPLAPPVPLTIEPDGSIVSRLTMRPIHEGPPGGVHGGWVAAVFDQMLGVANIVSGVGAMTAELTIRYRKPTPIDVPLEIRARTDSVDGRRVRSSGEITANAVVTAEATGLFLLATPERMAEHRAHVEDNRDLS
ncbi:MAG TPA: PaaI family thioesterase [Mycobacteriales bacterium]|nr:PaaI family thioesterase [Mycobacteriales bacterium]